MGTVLIVAGLGLIGVHTRFPNEDLEKRRASLVPEGAARSARRDRDHKRAVKNEIDTAPTEAFTAMYGDGEAETDEGDRREFAVISSSLPFWGGKNTGASAASDMIRPARVPHRVGSSPTWTSVFPKLPPRIISPKTSGIVSMPWRMSSRYLTWPAATQPATSRRKAS